MEIRQRAIVSRPVEEVWSFLADTKAVTECIPGATLTEELDGGRFRGTFKASLGPVSTKLEGEGVLERDDVSLVGTITGKGVDRRGGSRVSATITYAVQSDGEQCAIEVRSDIKLSGRLAQVGRTGILEDVAARLTEEFAANVRERLVPDPRAESGPDSAHVSSPAPADELKVGRIAAQGLWSRSAGWLRRTTRSGQ